MSVIENNLIYSDDLKTLIGVDGAIIDANIKDTVRTIMPKVFCNHQELANVKLPKNLRTIGSQAFAGCTSLREVKIPNSVSTMGAYAFADSGLKKVTLSDRLEKIEDGAFSDCKFLHEINFSDYLLEIGEKAFCGCINLKEVMLPDDVTYVGPSAFASCEQLKDVEFNEDIQFIEENAFYKTAIENVRIPSSVILVGNNAFGFCRNLENVSWETEMKPANEKIKMIFKDSENLKTISHNGLPIDVNNFAKSLDEIINMNKRYDRVDTIVHNYFER